MRLMFRLNYGGDRYLFRGRALYPDGFTPHKGFRGFDVYGAVQMENGEVGEVQPEGYTVLWGHQEFEQSF